MSKLGSEFGSISAGGKYDSSSTASINPEIIDSEKNTNTQLKDDQINSLETNQNTKPQKKGFHLSFYYFFIFNCPYIF